MKGKICIVDHDLVSQVYLRECLEREGHQVKVLESGSQIKSSPSKEGYDVYILNLDTPGIRDKGFLLKIKASHRSRILLIVSERGDAFLKEAMDLGVYGFIYKPLSHEEICTMVTHLVR
jgi:DNA-binding NtrC family response regulator